MPRTSLYLIDGNSYVYRSFFAIKGLKNSAGVPTNAVYGFASTLLKILAEEKPGYIAVAFDMPAPTFRHEMYPGYKANRPSMPDELREQFPVIKEMVSAFNVSMFEMAGYEADDIIATLAKKFERESEVSVLSQDKDCLQIISPGIRVIRENKTRRIYDEESVRAEYGVGPAQLADVMALCGDASDNVKGVPGVGVKTAAGLIRRFGSVEALVSDADSVDSPKLRGDIRLYSGKILVNKKLVSLDINVPVKAGIDKLRTAPPSADRIRDLFLRMEFKKLLEKINVLL